MNSESLEQLTLLPPEDPALAAVQPDGDEFAEGTLDGKWSRTSVTSDQVFEAPSAATFGTEGTIAPETKVDARPTIAAPDITRLPLLDIYSLKHHPRNVRKHNLPKIAESLRHYGQQKNVVVQASTNYIVAGNGTVRAARDILGWITIHGSVVEMDDDTALRYLLADNEANDAASNDKAALAALLKELEAGSQGLQGTLFSLDEAEDIYAEIGAITTVGGEFHGGYAETPEEFEARVAAKSAASKGTVKEVALALTAEQFEAFALSIAKLQRAYGTKNVAETVLEALRRGAEQVVA